MLALAVSLQPAAAAPLAYFLPGAGEDYREDVPMPSAVLGQHIGDWHLRHDQLITYLRTLAEKSDRVQFEEIGRTHEERPLVILTISTPENLARLEEIRKEHQILSQPRRKLPRPIKKMPLVINMGYGVHGNESSASNAAPLVAYHLAASNADAVRDLLANTVILLDPCLNPDGFARFAQWANSHRGKHPVAAAVNREHNEVWPGGRTNHYWFDLNRDWLLAQHPESIARLRKFHQWRPNLLTDFHEMGSDSTYFFQPGVPERRNPLTPERNVTLTKRLAAHHARALDEIGSLYYSEERFDDFYYGKGSTYPDVHGGVGILFEQASSRGHLRESIHDEFDFAFTIRNQVRTSLSTLEGAAAMRGDLLRHQREFYQSALTLAEEDPVRGYLFGHARDTVSNFRLLDLLYRHRIVVHPLRAGREGFTRGAAWIVPTLQPQYRLLKSLFEKRTTFDDTVFYDVSAWNLPLAMGIPFTELRELPEEGLGDPLKRPGFPAAPEPATATVAYAFEWHTQYAPRALNRLHRTKLRTKLSPRPFTARTTEGDQEFDRGTVLLPLGIQQDGSARNITRILKTIAARDGIKVHALTSGLTPAGPDLGSPGSHPLKAPEPLLLVGSGVSAYEAGEVWHLLDQRHDVEVTLVESGKLGDVDLHDYTHLLLVNGKYDLDEKRVGQIRNWLEEGGIIIATKSAAKWASKNKLGTTVFRDRKEEEKKEEELLSEEEKALLPTRPLPYETHQHDKDSKLTKGAIFATTLDTTHPLGFGITGRDHAVFRNSNLVMRPGRDPYATVARYTDDPLLAGYVHEENLKHISGSAAVIAERVKGGAVISFVDNPNFRAFWTGTSKVYLNALFFGSTIEQTAEETDEAGEDHGHRE